MLSNLSQTLLSSTKSKNKQVAKIRSILFKKQKSVPKNRFPEGLENTPLNTTFEMFWPFCAVVISQNIILYTRAFTQSYLTTLQYCISLRT